MNDTVLQTDPTADPDLGEFFQLLHAADYSPTWYSQRVGGGMGALEQAAAAKAVAHANTPSTAWFDTLGRPFLTVLDNAGGTMFPARVQLDIQGNQRAVRDAINQAGDAQGRVVMSYDHDMLKRPMHQASMEAGERWTLNDVAGKAIRVWDSRGHNFRSEYDVLRRPTGAFVLGTDSVNSDPRTLAAEVLTESVAYGEAQPAALNLRTRVYQHADAAGIVTNTGTNPVTSQPEGFDFKGNLLRSRRAFFADYKALPDLTAPPPTPDVFTGSTQYDALNRPTASTAPDGSVLRPTYNEANLLETAAVNLRSSATPTSFVTNIDYDAKGRRLLVQFGNGAATAYSYDPLTFRLTNLTTTRSGFPSNERTVQALAYVYDPVGNITHIQDDADLQNVVFFRNQRVQPSNDYTYDAIYRLTQATGREQLGLGGNGSPLPPTASSYNDVPRIGLLSPSDGMAMGTYTEQYQYDPVGNFLQFTHRGSQPSNPGWTRTYSYAEASLLEPGKFSNRLTSTAISGSQSLNEPYCHDRHGNMTRMPQLQAMQWSFMDELLISQRQAVNASDDDGVLHQGERTYYVYDASGQRVRKVTERQAAGGQTPTRIKEFFYVGGFESYREYDGTGTGVTLERETLHVMDDRQRLALVETRTQGNDGSLALLIRYQFSNHLASASLELDDAGHVISYEEYCPYGNTSYEAGRSVVEVSLKRYRYTGKERDKESGLSYQGARYYAPWLARWVSCDPAGLLDRLDLYVFCRDSPTNWTDGSGHAPEKGKAVEAALRSERSTLDKLGKEQARLLTQKGEQEVNVSSRTTDIDLAQHDLESAQTGQLNRGEHKALEQGSGTRTQIKALERANNKLAEAKAALKKTNETLKGLDKQIKTSESVIKKLASKARKLGADASAAPDDPEVTSEHLAEVDEDVLSGKISDLEGGSAPIRGVKPTINGSAPGSSETVSGGEGPMGLRVYGAAAGAALGVAYSLLTKGHVDPKDVATAAAIGAFPILGVATAKDDGGVVIPIVLYFGGAAAAETLAPALTPLAAAATPAVVVYSTTTLMGGQTTFGLHGGWGGLLRGPHLRGQ